MYKPAYKTSEFWFTLVSFIMSGLFLSGVISEPETKDRLTEVFTHVVESVILLGGQVILFSKYIQKRHEQKIAYEQNKRKEYEELQQELEDYVGVDKNHSTVNINTATIAEIIQLPHIGPVTAKNIIEYRKQHKFSSINELTKINGISKTVLKNIKPYIIL